MRIALYARVSTDDEGQNPENQLAELRQWASRAGHENVGEYVDRVSGRKNVDLRKQFAALLADAHKRKFDVVAVWALDRFSREGIEATGDYLRQLKRCGVSLHSFTEPYLSTDNELVYHVLQAVMAWRAKTEAELISERVKAGIKRRRRTHRDGAWGTRPIEQKNPDKVRRIRAMLRSGTGIGKVARTLRVGTGTVHRIAREMRSDDC
jgi:DNA invertase Pin-like site-specific DNA recombinase